MRPSLAAVVLLFAIAATAAFASEDQAPDAVTLFQARARVLDPASENDVARLRDDLLARGTGSFSEGPFLESERTRSWWHQAEVRSALARALTDQHVDTEIRAAARSQSVDVLARNLRGRRGLGAALVRCEAVASAGPDAARRLSNVAIDDVIDGDRTLAIALLADDRVALQVAQDIAESHYPSGLAFVTDVLTGRTEVPTASRAALAGFRVNLGDIRDTRPLDEERCDALLRVAREDPDPALRVAAAHVLHFAGATTTLPAAYAAKAAARSRRIDLGDWDWLGKQGPPPAGLRLAPFRVARATRGWIYLSHVRASDDPLGAEEMAAGLVRLYRESEDPRTRGALVRLVEEVAYCFTDVSTGRPRLVPSFAALLDEWEHEGDGGDATLNALESRVATRLRRELAFGDSPDATRSSGAAESPALAVLPESAPLPDETAAAVVAWLDADPGHLHDNRVRRHLVSWGDTHLARVLAAYPEAALRAMLTAPPTAHYPQHPKARPMDDPSGSAARLPLLDLLASDPRHADRLRDAALWSGWPDRDRRYAGAQLHRLTLAGSSTSAETALRDDAFAAGFVDAALEGEGHARDPGLLLAAQVISRTVDRPALRGLIVDSDQGDADPDLACGLALDDATNEGLLRVLRGDSDPHASMIAARLLLATGRPDAFDAVLAEDTWLMCGDAYGGSSWAQDIAWLVRDAATRDAVLRYVADDAREPRGRVDALETLVGLHWVEETFGDDPLDGVVEARQEEEMRVLGAWLRAQLAGLDADVAEGVAEAWFEQPVYETIPEERWDAADAWMLAVLRDALAEFPEGAVKDRMAALLEPE